MAALTALRLVARGELELAQDVNERLGSWALPSGEGVTLRRLLSHTAGLGVPFFAGYESDAPVPSLVEILDGVPPANTEPVRVEAPPGSAFRYSGAGYALLQFLLEEVAGAPFAELADELVLRPLGMADSTFVQQRGPSHVYPEQAAAGLRTTPSDLARFVLAVQQDVTGAAEMLSSQVELPAEGEWMLLRQLGIEPPRRFGLGLFLSDGGWFGHLGGAFGYFSVLFGSVADGKGAVVMSEGDASPALFEALLAVAAEYGWDGFATVVDS